MSWLQKLAQEHVYHAQPHITPGTLNPRTPKNYNSIGTWFSSSEDEAGYLYGPNITKYPVPQGNIIEQEDFESSFIDLELIQKHFGQAAADHMRMYPWTRQNRERERLLYRKFEREMQRLSRQESQEYRALQKSEKIYRDAILSADYILDLRQKLAEQGINGFVWRNSNIDSPKQPHDVYVVFNEQDIEPA